jgi:hypothetical protein
LLLRKFNNYGLSSGYLNRFLSYLTNRQSRVPYSAILSSHFVVQTGVFQGSVLGPFVFNIFINDLCDVINHFNGLIFADDLKIYQEISLSSDCLLLQSDIVYINGVQQIL